MVHWNRNNFAGALLCRDLFLHFAAAQNRQTLLVSKVDDRNSGALNNRLNFAGLCVHVGNWRTKHQRFLFKGTAYIRAKNDCCELLPRPQDYVCCVPAFTFDCFRSSCPPVLNGGVKYATLHNRATPAVGK